MYFSIFQLISNLQKFSKQDITSAINA
jgi:hypothetical protein